MSVWGAVKNVATLGGAHRIESAKARIEAAKTVYESTVDSIARSRDRVDEKIRFLRLSARVTKRHLRLAQKMIAPVRNARRFHASVGADSSSMSQLYRSPTINVNHTSGAATLGLATTAGTVASIAAWQGVQIVGTASTGTAILGLHGAAASNAGWAFFGGGSLATGGGGMAVGHLVLPGIGLAVMVGVGAFTTHKKANELNVAAQQIEEANSKNALVLRQANEQELRVDRAAELFSKSDASLSEAVRLARRKLRRYGVLSVAYRYIRLKARGYFYTEEEESTARSLEKAVNEFMSVFGVSSQRA